MKQDDYDFSLLNKVALITGAAAGIGRVISKAFLQKGAKVAMLDINPSVSDSKDNNILAIQSDITQKESVDEALDKIMTTFGRLDILVNCAGIVLLDESKNLSEEYWRRTIDINLTGTYRMSQAAGRIMLKQKKGRIINLASQAGIVALERHLAYCVSKAGVIALTQVMALEWSAEGVTVNAISPTVVLTELGKKAWSGEVGEVMKQKIPAKRFATPEDIAAAAIYLAGNLSEMITGTNLVIDGGYTIQ